MIVLGIESSCDETGAALISDTKGLLADALHTQIDMHRAYGGVVPELASRDHIRRVIALTDEVLYKANLKRSDISAIAVTEGPGLAGALLAGNASRARYGIWAGHSRHRRTPLGRASFSCALGRSRSAVSFPCTACLRWTHPNPQGGLLRQL